MHSRGSGTSGVRVLGIAEGWGADTLILRLSSPTHGFAMNGASCRSDKSGSVATYPPPWQEVAATPPGANKFTLEFQCGFSSLIQELEKE